MNTRLSITFTTLVLFLAADGVFAGSCKKPTPSQNFTRDNYSGTWFEIAKFQTAGGAYFEKDCVCTQLSVRNEGAGGYFADNICRFQTPSGKLTKVTETLSNENPAGRFQASVYPLAPSVDYNILFLGERDGEEYSVEYDCGSNFLTGTNYCVHFLSRKPTMSDKLLNYLIDEVNKLELNAENLPLEMTKQ